MLTEHISYGLQVCSVQMLGLNVYSYVEDADVPFYKTSKSLAKKMDILH